MDCSPEYVVDYYVDDLKVNAESEKKCSSTKGKTIEKFQEEYQLDLAKSFATESTFQFETEASERISNLKEEEVWQEDLHKDDSEKSPCSLISEPNQFQKIVFNEPSGDEKLLDEVAKEKENPLDELLGSQFKFNTKVIKQPKQTIVMENSNSEESPIDTVSSDQVNMCFVSENRIEERREAERKDNNLSTLENACSQKILISENESKKNTENNADSNSLDQQNGIAGNEIFQSHNSYLPKWLNKHHMSKPLQTQQMEESTRIHRMFQKLVLKTNKSKKKEKDLKQKCNNQLWQKWIASATKEEQLTQMLKTKKETIDSLNESLSPLTETSIQKQNDLDNLEDKYGDYKTSMVTSLNRLKEHLENLTNFTAEEKMSVDQKLNQIWRLSEQVELQKDHDSMNSLLSKTNDVSKEVSTQIKYLETHFQLPNK